MKAVRAWFEFFANRSNVLVKQVPDRRIRQRLISVSVVPLLRFRQSTDDVIFFPKYKFVRSKYRLNQVTGQYSVLDLVM